MTKGLMLFHPDPHTYHLKLNYQPFIWSRKNEEEKHSLKKNHEKVDAG